MGRGFQRERSIESSVCDNNFFFLVGVFVWSRSKSYAAEEEI